MTTLDERVAYLEGKVDEHSRGFGELRDTVRQLDGRIVALDEKVDRLFERLDARITGLDAKLDRSIAELGGRLDGRITGLEATMRDGFVRLDERMSRQFLWILGVQIAVLVAVIGALTGP